MSANVSMQSADNVAQTLRIIPYLEDKYPDRKKLGKPDEVDKV